jgi:hypothetical protein
MNQAMIMRAVPALAVMGYASYSVWNDEGTTAPPEKKTSASARLDKGLYDPQLLPTPPRDPFDPLAGAPRPMDETAKKDLATRDPSGNVTGTSTGTTADGAPAAKPVVEDPTTLFQLGATMVSGPRRCALINGRIYDIGEVIAPVNARGVRERYTLTSIERDGVMLQGKSRRPVVVTFVAARKEPKTVEAVATAAAAEPSGAEMGLAQLLLRSGGASGQPATPAMNLLSLLGLGAAHP